MNQKPDEQQLSQAATVIPSPRTAEPATPGAPTDSSAAPVRTDTDTGEMWIQL